jgi:hypothetical protein
LGRLDPGSASSAEHCDTLFFTGYAKLPAGITATEMFRVVGIGLEVKARTGEIIAADCTLATEVGRRFFANLVEGRRLDEDFAILVNLVEKRYYGNAQKAIITALKIAREKFRAYRENPDARGD